MPEISNETFAEQQPTEIVKKEEITEKRKKELDKLVRTIEVSLAGKLKGKTYEEIVESVVSESIILTRSFCPIISAGRKGL